MTDGAKSAINKIKQFDFTHQTYVNSNNQMIQK